MTRRYTGGFLSATEQATDANTANGIFTLQEAGAATAAGNFPTGRWTPQRSLRFRGSAASYLYKNPFGTPTSQTTWTFSTWFKGDAYSGALLGHSGANSGATNTFNLVGFGYYNGYSFGIRQVNASGSITGEKISSALFRDPSAWYHFTAVWDTTNPVADDRIRIYVNGVRITSFAGSTNPSSGLTSYINTSGWVHYLMAYNIGGAAYQDGYLSEVNFVDGQALDSSYFGMTDAETGSWVPKKYTGTYGNNGFYLPFTDNSAATADAIGKNFAPQANYLQYSEDFANTTYWRMQNATITSNTAVAPDTTTTADTFTDNSTNAAHRVENIGYTNDGWVFTSGKRVTISYYAKYISQQYVGIIAGGLTGVTATWRQRSACFDILNGTVSRAAEGGSESSITSVGNGWYRLSLTLTPNVTASDYASFNHSPDATMDTTLMVGTGKQTYIWGAQLNDGGLEAYSKTTTVALNNWSPNNVSLTAGVTYDSMVDVPGIAAVTSQPDVGGVQRGNYATINPLDWSVTKSTVNDGNLKWTTNTSGSNNYQNCHAFPSSGKWYAELNATQVNIGSGLGYVAIHLNGANSYLWWVYSSPYYQIYGTGGSYSTIPSISSGDTIMVAVDMDAGKAWYGHNGTWLLSGSPVGGVPMSNPVTFTQNRTDLRIAVDGRTGSNNNIVNVNFGQRPFSYTPPTGFKTVCNTNLPNPVIKRPKDHFDIKKYVGNGDALTIGNTQKQTSAYKVNKSLRFNESMSEYLYRYITTNSSQKTFTISAWVKLSKVSSAKNYIYTSGDSGSIAVNYLIFDMQSSGFAYSSNYIEFTAVASNSTVCSVVSNVPFNDTTQWQHVMVAVDTTQTVPANRIKIYQNGTQVTNLRAASYPSLNADIPFINNSAYTQRIGQIATYGSYDGYMAEYNFIDGSQKTPSDFGQFDGNNNWVPKRYTGTYGTNGFYLNFSNAASGSVDITSTATATAPFGGTIASALVDDANYMTSNTTTGSSFTLVNYDFGTPVQISQWSIRGLRFTGGTSSGFQVQVSNDASSWTNISSLAVTNSGQNFSGVCTLSARYIRLQATSFGTNGQGIINAFLIYTDNIGLDSSGVGSPWINSGFTLTGATYESMYDSPTDTVDSSGNIVGNYATINAADVENSYATVSNAGLTVYNVSSASHVAFRSSLKLPKSNGKIYWEVKVNGDTGTRNSAGINLASSRGGASSSLTGLHANTAGWYFSGTNSWSFEDKGTGDVFVIGSGVSGNIAMFAYDAATGKFWVGRNGTWYNNAGSGTGNPSTGANPTTTLNPTLEQDYYAGGSVYSAGSGSTLDFNFGQRAFSYTPPTGFTGLNTKTLKDVGSYDLPDSFGNFVNTPDLVWVKNRDSGAIGYRVSDTVRGVSRQLYTHQNTGQTTDTDGLQAFLPNGFAIGNSTGYNTDSNNHISWNWNRGKIPGFDIVTYAGDSVNTRMIPHNLGQKPAFYITKNLDGYNATQGYSDWNVYHKDAGASAYGGAKSLFLMSNIIAGAAGGFYSYPTSDTFNPNQTAYDNVSGHNYIAYLWAEVPGFSKFGTYTGNGAADGPFINLGFKPRWVMFKKSSSASEDWAVYDTAREQFNPMATELFPNTAGADYNGNRIIDILSNGIKIRSAGATTNSSGASYVYAAFAENPFKYANAR